MKKESFYANDKQEEIYMSENGWEYRRMADGNACITRYMGTDTVLCVPEYVDGGLRKVTAIDSHALSTGLMRNNSGHGRRPEQKHMKEVTSITIPDSVIRIGNEAFAGCRELRQIRIPESAELEADAFFGCYKLRNAGKLFVQGSRLWAYIEDSPYSSRYRYPDAQTILKIPEGITEIAPYALSENRHLKKLVLPDSIEKIGKGAFELCTDLEEIVMPKVPKEIAPDAFRYCEKLLSKADYFILNGELMGVNPQLVQAIIPEGIEVIHSHVFNSHRNLESVVLPASLTTIEEEAFSNCQKLKEVTFCTGNLTIAGYAFAFCSALEHIRLPEGLIELPNSLFANSVNLKTVVIPGSVQVIRRTAFNYLSNVTIIGEFDSEAERYAMKNSNRGFVFENNT